MNPQKILMTMLLIPMAVGWAGMAGAMEQGGAPALSGPAGQSLTALAETPPLEAGARMDGAFARGDAAQAVNTGATAHGSDDAQAAAGTKSKSDGDAPPEAPNSADSGVKGTSGLGDRGMLGIYGGLAELMAGGFAAGAAGVASFGAGVGVLGMITGLFGATFLAAGIIDHNPVEMGVGAGLLALTALAMLTPFGAAAAAGALALGGLVCLGKAIFGK